MHRTCPMNTVKKYAGNGLKGGPIVARNLENFIPFGVTYKNSFELSDNTPICFTDRRIPERHKEVIKDGNMVKASVITPTESLWDSRSNRAK